jgi:hypothetical protein
MRAPNAAGAARAAAALVLALCALQACAMTREDQCELRARHSRAIGRPPPPPRTAAGAGGLPFIPLH